MNHDKIDLLVTFNRNYIGPFRTMLRSLLLNNPGESFRVWLLHSAIAEEDLQELEEFCGAQGVSFTALRVDRSAFRDAPISRQYPQEMYYRLLAPQLLPASVERVLYLDSDILVLNPVRPLWEMDLGDCAFAAASHSGVLDVMNGVNRIRLRTDHDYYNSGVMLMDLVKAREIVRPEDIFACVREHSAELVLPDQDVFNFLYGKKTLPLPDEVWNYDARYYHAYLIRSEGTCQMDWVMQNTVFLHFCGKRKPWSRQSANRFSALYKHYMRLASR